MAGSEAIWCVVTDGASFYSLRLNVTPDMKNRVVTRDIAHPLIEGNALQIKWGAGHVQSVVPTLLQTHSRYASADKITSEFIINLIYNDQLSGVLDIVRQTGTKTWGDMEYLPVPVPEKNVPAMEPPKSKDAPRKVTLLMPGSFTERC